MNILNELINWLDRQSLKCEKQTPYGSLIIFFGILVSAIVTLITSVKIIDSIQNEWALLFGMVPILGMTIGIYVSLITLTITVCRLMFKVQ
jgi:hypothetical protein